MNLEECFEQRLLRNIPPDVSKSNKSLELAKKSLSDAMSLIELEVFDMALVKSYLVMFHSARALLYKGGVQEKSHYAIQIYLKEKYSNEITASLISAFDIHRLERHQSLYGFDFTPELDDCLSAIEDAKSFLKEVSKILS